MTSLPSPTDPVFTPDASESNSTRLAVATVRKMLRERLAEFKQRSTPLALTLLAADFLWFAIGLAMVITLPWWGMMLGSFLTCIAIARLFVIGHDACHQSLTDSRRLNKWLGRIAFLPSLTAYSLWEVGHNVVHHGFSNLKGRDYVWEPLTLAEYQALSPRKRLMERIYRSGLGFGAYYLISIWWDKLYFPNARVMPTRRPIFTRDCLLVTGFAAVWIAGLVAGALALGHAVLPIVLAGFVVPFLGWNMLMGFVVYLHHTHPDVVWYNDKDSWSAEQGYLTSTIETTLPFGLNRLLHNIMDHPVHHVDMGVPLYRLPQAQRALAKILGPVFPVEKFRWSAFMRTVRLCKLYDFENRRWLGFDGQPAR